jgi:hypothetical protein
MARVIDRDLGWKAIKQEMLKAKTLEVAVGILEGSKNGEGFSIAEYAAANEFGTDKIPERPFMRTAFDESKAKISQDMNREGKRMALGQSTAQKALTIIGQRHASRIQNVVTGRDFAPKLSPQTVKAKKGSTKTLVDTSAMVNAVQIEVRART